MALLLAAALPALAAERGAAAGTGVTTSASVESRLEVGDRPGHVLVQSRSEEQLTTPDRIGGVSFDGAAVQTFKQADLADGSGVVRGYSVWKAKSGDQLFLVFGYGVPPFPSAEAEYVRFEGTFEWIGGTGALAGLRGKGTIEGEASRVGVLRYRWAGSYERNERKEP